MTRPPASVPVQREELERLRQRSQELGKVMAARAKLEGKKTTMMLARKNADTPEAAAFAAGWLKCFLEDWEMALTEQEVDSDLPF